MCGIIGFIKDDCIKDIYNGLQLLEYRGYDSVGIGFNINGKTQVIKRQGRVKDIYSQILNIKTNIGIGHTRWATHGEPSQINAHPHKYQAYTIVHNGIIENCDTLKAELIQKGYSFLSQTDSEVIAVLLQDNHTPNKPLEGIKAVLSKLMGSYAIAILSEYEPDSIFLAKKDNPLILGKGENFYCFASDTPALVAYTQNIYKMQDNEIALVNKLGFQVFDANLKKRKISFKKTYLSINNINKGIFDTYMLKEIYEIPQSITNTENHLKTLKFPSKIINKERFDYIIVIGCGTAYHAGLYAQNLFKKSGFVNTICTPSSEFLLDDTLVLNNRTLLIAISQSGETADTICGMKKAKECGCYVLAITNVPYSTVTTISDYCIVTRAGAEIAVASTKSYATQLVAIQYIANKLLNFYHQPTPLNFTQQIQTLIELSDTQIRQYVSQHNFENLFFIGIGCDYQIALEGALKAKEISYIYCDAIHSGEIKHGPLALVGKETLVIAIITQKSHINNSLNSINEVITRGANVLIISQFDLKINNQIKLPYASNQDMSILAIIPLQLLAYHLSKIKGLDPDKPRNLAKSVTVR